MVSSSAAHLLQWN